MLYEGIVSHKHINGFLQFNTSARMRELRLPVDFSLDITSQLLSLVISTGGGTSIVPTLLSPSLRSLL